MSNVTDRRPTHCAKGHSLADAYVWKRYDRPGTQRRCRVCFNEASNARQKAKRGTSTQGHCPCGAELGPRGRKWCDECRPTDRHNGRSGRPYERLKAQVRAEEPTCWICGADIDPDLLHPHPLSFQLDHVVAVAAGGSVLDRSNVRASHAQCNNRRGKGEVADLRSEVSRLRAEVAALRAALNLR